MKEVVKNENEITEVKKDVEVKTAEEPKAKKPNVWRQEGTGKSRCYPDRCWYRCHWRWGRYGRDAPGVFSSVRRG